LESSFDLARRPVTQSGAALETQGTVMALLDPHRPAPERSDGKLHPCMDLIMGFGVITAAAVVVHVVMGAVL
jgi:predicted methyltransferase